MKVLKKFSHVDPNNDSWDVLKLDGRYGIVWCIVRSGNSWDFPFFISKKKAIQSLDCSV